MRRFVHFLRSVAYTLWMLITVVPWALAVLAASLFIRGTPLYRLCRQWVSMAVWGADFFCGIRSHVVGMENLPDGPVILCPKHQSAWETLALMAMMPRPLCYVFKRELLWVPFFGWAMSRLDMVHIDRSKRANAWSRVAEQGQRFMAQGNWLIMFPEGTRTRRGSQGQYKNGASRMAITVGVPVLPIAVTSARCWPRNSFVKIPGVIEVSIGRPIASTGRQSDELMREVEAWIESEMRRLDPEAYPAPA
jgi:1-acyl-sn-glycerol-3-phosphate acyltransferase